MLKKFYEIQKENNFLFQVLFLNDESNHVEIQEAEHVDYMRVKRHVNHGGSVFITSKSSQKLAMPREKKKCQKTKKEWVMASYFCK